MDRSVDVADDEDDEDDETPDDDEAADDEKESVSREEMESRRLHLPVVATVVVAVGRRRTWDVVDERR